jgi:tetratricopeptide (TPR) repeat protein
MSGNNRLLGGRYQFIQVLGTGRWGQTLLVADVHYSGHPKCVVKQIPLPTRNPTTLKFVLNLLKKNIEVLEMLGRDDRIPNTFAFFEDHQNLYLVQEFLPGHSLGHELKAGHPWSQAQVLDVLQEVLQILAFLQEHGVTHGNLKPTNIIRHHTRDRLMLCDFSLFKDLEREGSGRAIAEEGRLPQDWVYVPLEQRQGRPRFCTDHYALGVIAIQAATGLPMDKLPDAEDPEVHRKFTTLLQTGSDISTSAASLIARMVHPDGDRRYQKAVEVLADLNRIITRDGGELPTTGDASVAFPVKAPVTQPQPTASQPDAARQRPTGRWVALGVGGAIALLAGLLFLRVPQKVWAQRHLQAAQAAQTAGETEAAIDRYNRVLDLLPHHAPALAARGALYGELGNSEAALQDLTQAIDSQPDQAEWLYQRGNIRFTVGDIQGALKDYTEALDADATLVNAYMNRGSARAEWGDDQGAIQDYTQALALEPDLATQAAAHLNRCLSYSNMEQQREALEDCTTAIDLQPNYGLAYENRGLVRRRLNDFQGAIQDYNIAIQIDPTSPHPYYNRGLARQDLGDLTGAMADLSKAIALDPEYLFAFYDRGLLQARMGRPEQAITDLETAAQQCLDLGRVQCYEDARYQIQQIQLSQGGGGASTDG